MAASSPIRIDDDLYTSAKAVDSLTSRSPAQQISPTGPAPAGNWRRPAASPTETQRGSPTHQIPYDDLGPAEQEVARAGWAKQVMAHIEVSTWRRRSPSRDSPGWSSPTPERRFTGHLRRTAGRRHIAAPTTQRHTCAQPRRHRQAPGYGNSRAERPFHPVAHFVGGPPAGHPDGRHGSRPSFAAPVDSRSPPVGVRTGPEG